jgi:hypothetical protein
MDKKGGKKENEKDNVLTLPFQRVDFALSTCCLFPLLQTREREHLKDRNK